MCNPDLSVFPMQWGATYVSEFLEKHNASNSPDSTRLPIGLDEGHHQCLQWDKIDSWAKERSLDVFAPGVIVHPALGKSSDWCFRQPVWQISFYRFSNSLQVKHILVAKEMISELFLMC